MTHRREENTHMKIYRILDQERNPFQRCQKTMPANLLLPKFNIRRRDRATSMATHVDEKQPQNKMDGEITIALEKRRQAKLLARSMLSSGILIGIQVGINDQAPG